MKSDYPHRHCCHYMSFLLFKFFNFSETLQIQNDYIFFMHLFMTSMKNSKYKKKKQNIK